MSASNNIGFGTWLKLGTEWTIAGGDSITCVLLGLNDQVLADLEADGESYTLDAFNNAKTSDEAFHEVFDCIMDELDFEEVSDKYTRVSEKSLPYVTKLEQELEHLWNAYQSRRPWSLDSQ
jgi:hypothetical protein